MTEVKEELLRPLVRTGKAFYALFGLLLAILAWFGYTWYTQLTQGLVVTGMGNSPSGAPWGIYISAFIFTIGTASAGMSIGLLSRVANVKEFHPIRRIAELTCVTFLILMFLFVLFDLGRPDRILNLFTSGQILSPLYWDIVVVTLYLVLSTIAIYLPLRTDMANLKHTVSGWRRLIHRILGWRYSKGEVDVHERAGWWLAIAILLVMAAVHAGVVPWIFGLVAARAGWYNPFYAQYFGLAHVFNGFAVVIIIVAIVRRFLKLQDLIPPETFKKLGLALLILTVLYLHFMFSEQLTMRFAPPTAEFEVSQQMLFGAWGWAYWAATFFLVSSVLILVSPLRGRVSWVVLAGVFTSIALYLKRIVIIVPPLIRSRLPFYPTGVYVPTWVEWSLTIGAFALGTLIIALFIKLFPIIEMEAVEKGSK
ncbi:MAG: NrfD/PsrC family molybdoenzyme membrane anchor subunit [Candidatus Bathyarchaeia archaeon]